MHEGGGHPRLGADWDEREWLKTIGPEPVGPDFDRSALKLLANVPVCPLLAGRSCLPLSCWHHWAERLSPAVGFGALQRPGPIIGARVLGGGSARFQPSGGNSSPKPSCLGRCGGALDWPE